MRTRRVLSLAMIMCLMHITTYAQPSTTHNYIKIKTYTNDNGANRTKIVYYDELGREEQNIMIGTPLSNQSVVSMTEYDEYGRKSKEWLQGRIGAYDSSFVSTNLLQDSIKSANSNDLNPYSLTQYEASPLNRPVAQFGPGKQWYDNNKSVRTDYLLNISGDSQLDCKRYSVTYSITNTSISATIVNHGSWNTGSMTVKKTTDEDGNISYEFRDRNDEVTLIRQMSGTICYDTYYIRDDWGNLLAVLPPIAADQTKNTNTWYSSSTVIANYAYLYCYDKRYRQIGKKLPGCEWVFTIYDKSDYPVLTQDGRQRDLTPKEWTVTIPDAWGRPCKIETKTGTHNLNNDNVCSASVIATRSGTDYTVSGFSYTPKSTLTVNYYDDYTFIGNDNIPSSLNYQAQSLYGTKLTDTPAGQLTGIKSLLLNDDPTPVYVYKAIFYDYHYKPIQTRSTNHLGGTELEFCFYDLPGYLKRSLHVHSAPGKTTRQLKNTYTYDMWGRLLTRNHQIGNSTAVTVVDNNYDAIGRLKINKRNNNTNLKTTYNYNVRSWLTSLVNPKFTESLYYNVVQYGGTSAARWGGDISGQTWRFPNGAYQSYDFSYDKLNRLTSAVYTDSDGNDDAFSTEYSYDKHGNLTAITRNAITDDIGPLPLDDLYLSYTGNQLTGVSNTANVYEFSNYYPYLAPGTNAFTYDQNGNTTKDLNKSISSIQYNLLNLPRRITYSDGSMATYTYTSLGEKVQVVYSTSQTTASQPSTNIVEASEDMKGSRDNNLRTAMVPTTMNYCGNVIYNGNSLSRILLDGEGYATISKIPTYYFFIKDHLGNTRATLQSNGTVKQTNQYYPFGKRWDDMGETFKQPYLYNCKELDEMHDLSWYDYGARMYEPALGRFMTIDPMAEKYYNISAYCANNPVNYVDLHGDSLTLSGTIQDIELAVSIYNKGLGGFYTVNADKNGLLSLSPVDGKNFGNMSETQKYFYNMLDKVINGNGMATINIEHGSDVLIGDISNYKIDISDIMNIGDGPYISSESVLGHETLEEYLVQTSTAGKSKMDIINSAHLKASGFERLITGSYLDPINRIIVNDKMKIPVVGKNHSITIHFNNNNVKSVTR